MSEKAKKSKVKDLEPKSHAKNVTGGCLCCPNTDGLDQAAAPTAAYVQGKVRRAINPR